MSEVEVIDFGGGKRKTLEQDDLMWICLSERRLRSEGDLIETVPHGKTLTLYLYLNSLSKIYIHRFHIVVHVTPQSLHLHRSPRTACILSHSYQSKAGHGILKFKVQSVDGNSTRPVHA